MVEEGFAAATEGPPPRPPSVSESLWSSVPDAFKAEFLKKAAKDLRRGVHPEDSIGAMLESKGLNRPVKAAPAPAMRRPPPRSAPPPAAQPPRRDEPEGSAPPPRSGPLLAYGASPRPAGQEPVSVIGVAIHKEMRLSGKPGKAAADAESSVLKAIAADPVMAWSDPAGIRRLGARLTDAVADGIKELVRQEAERVIDDIRVRAAAGDPVALRWPDPDAWSMDFEETNGGPSP